MLCVFFLRRSSRSSMPNLVRIQLWRLPLDFFELPNDEARSCAVESVTIPAIPGPRSLPPMTAWEESLCMLYCMLLGTPLILLLLVPGCIAFGCFRGLVLVLGIVAMLYLQPLPRHLKYRRSRLAILLCRYFAMEFLFDRDDGPIAACAGTRGALKQDVPDGAVIASDGISRLHLACPHGVMNYGAVIFTSLSRWLVGVDQLTAVAGAVSSTPGLRQFAAPLWAVSASRASLSSRLTRGETIGLIPDGINGIFAGAEAGTAGRELLVLGRKRGLVRLALQSGAVCMPAYFIGTLQLFTICQDRFGVLRALSRRFRLSLFFFYGRFGLPIPRRHPLSAVIAFVPPPGGAGAKVSEPTDAQLEAHHEAVYSAGLVSAFHKLKQSAGLSQDCHLVIS